MSRQQAAPALLTLFGRSNCHLCEDMQRALQDIRKAISFELSVVDIDADPVLAEKYGEFVPVLMAGDTEICHYYLDPQALRSYFRHQAE